MLFSGKIYTAGKYFTRPLVVTVATNFNSVWLMYSIFSMFSVLSMFSELSPYSPNLVHLLQTESMFSQPRWQDSTVYFVFVVIFLCHFIFLYFPQLLVVIVAQTLSSPISYCRLPPLPTHHFHKIKGENINVKKDKIY